MNRRIVSVAHSVLRIDQRIWIPRIDIGTDVSGPACIYAQVEVAKGRVLYLQGEAAIRAPSSFVVFLPPFAVVQARLERCDVTTVSIAFRPPISHSLPRRPLLLAATGRCPPASGEEVIGRLTCTEGGVDVRRAPDPCPLASRTKAILDAEYGTAITIGRIAGQAQAAPARLSRTFKQTYGMPSVRYRHHLRIMDALMRFAEGAVPVDVFQDVGFDDLSRF